MNEILLGAVAGPGGLVTIISEYGFLGAAGLLVLYVAWQLAAIFIRAVRNRFDEPRSDRDYRWDGKGSGRRNDTRESGSAIHIRSRTRDCPGHCDRNSNPLKLRDHPLFSTYETLTGLKIPSLTCECPGRTEVFRDVSRLVLRTWTQAWYEYLDAEGRLKESEQRLIRTISDLIVAWQRNLQVAFVTDGIPPKVKEIFEEWALPHVDSLIERSREIAASQAYYTNYEKIAAIMSLHEFAMDTLVMALKRLIKSMNGRLDGHVYKGFTIQPVPPPEDDGPDTGPYIAPPPPTASPGSGSRSEGYRRQRSEEYLEDTYGATPSSEAPKVADPDDETPIVPVPRRE